MPVPGSLMWAAWRERRDFGRRRARVCVALWRKASAKVSLRLRPTIRCSSEDALDSLHDEDEFVFSPGNAFQSPLPSSPTNIRSATYHLDRHIFNTALKRTKPKCLKTQSAVAPAPNRNNYVDYRSMPWVGHIGETIRTELGYNERCIDDCIARTRAKDNTGESSSSGVESMTQDSEESTVSSGHIVKYTPETRLPPKVPNSYTHFRNRSRTSMRRASWQRISNKALASQFHKPLHKSGPHSPTQHPKPKVSPRYESLGGPNKAVVHINHKSDTLVIHPRTKVEPIYAQPLKKKSRLKENNNNNNNINNVNNNNRILSDCKNPPIETFESQNNEKTSGSDSPPPPPPRCPPPLPPSPPPLPSSPPPLPSLPSVPIPHTSNPPTINDVPPPRPPTPLTPPPLPSNPPPPIRSITRVCIIDSPSRISEPVNTYVASEQNSPKNERPGKVTDEDDGGFPGKSTGVTTCCATKESLNYVEVRDTSALCRLVIRAGLSTHDTGNDAKKLSHLAYGSYIRNNNSDTIYEATYESRRRQASVKVPVGSDALPVSKSEHVTEGIAKPAEGENTESWNKCTGSNVPSLPSNTAAAPPPPPPPSPPPITPTKLYKERRKSKNHQLAYVGVSRPPLSPLGNQQTKHKFGKPEKIVGATESKTNRHLFLWFRSFMSKKSLAAWPDHHKNTVSKNESMISVYGSPVI
ncbi:hypothetical protein SK128_021145 [Halocaridina rubra]|uniref:Uncharacterized protein n=1 Tax=Halocaridina rubra TaxID=373956 RepID=A0AAN8ZXJ7_HALRR